MSSKCYLLWRSKVLDVSPLTAMTDSNGYLELFGLKTKAESKPMNHKIKDMGRLGFHM